MRRALFALGLTLVASRAHAADFYASPSGSASGDGSRASPWDLPTALAATAAVRAGDTLWLLGGTYGTGGPTVFRLDGSSIQGTATAPIVIRGALGERATIDGGVDCAAGYIWFWGFEITNSSTLRQCTQVERPPGLNLTGIGDKAINLVIHDAGHPTIGFWNPVGDGGEVHGCVLWANGLYDTSPDFAGAPRGNGTYAQNTDGTRYITDNISFRNFTEGIDASSDGTAGHVDGFVIEGNIAFENPSWNIFTQTKTNPMKRLHVVGNYTYRATDHSGKGSLQLGYYSTIEHEDVEVRDNYLALGSDNDRAFFLKKWQSVNVVGNTVIGDVVAMWDSAATVGTRIWDRNTYQVRTGTEPFVLGDSVTGAGAPFQRLDLAGWRTATAASGGQSEPACATIAGFDNCSQLQSGVPTKNVVAVRKNRYEPKRANIAVYNWEGAATVDVDAAAVLSAGDTFEIRDAQDYFGTAVLSGTYDGAPIRLPIAPRPVAQPVGSTPHIGAFAHTAPEFGAYVLLGGTSMGPPVTDASGGGATAQPTSGEPAGCGCRAGSARNGPGAMFALVFFALARRRRCT